MPLAEHAENDDNIDVEKDVTECSKSQAESLPSISTDSNLALSSSPVTARDDDQVHRKHLSNKSPSVVHYCKKNELENSPTENLKHDLTTLDRDCVKIEMTPSISAKSNTCGNCGQELSNAVKASEIDAEQSESSFYSLSPLSNADLCRICHCEGDVCKDDLISPCKCKGSLTYVHHACLQRWIKSSGYKRCELCGFQFAMNSKLKPLSKWEKLSMSKAERRKVCCSVVFHLIAIICVVWSIYVLIERTANELNNGELNWPFWTKLVVVAVGLIGSLVFMYVQCKTYADLWRRLKAYNRIIYVQHQPIDAVGRQTTTADKTMDTAKPKANCLSNRDTVVVIGNCSDQNLNVL